MSKLDRVFAESKPILGMLHLGGDTPEDRLSRAEHEARILADAGVDGFVVENYFGDATDVERALERLVALNLGPRIGVNLLRDNDRAFALARQYPVDFIQIDSISGHLSPEDEPGFAAHLAQDRASVPALLLGGVRFKYQPVLSGRTEAEDLALGAKRCDAVVVTSDATGQETDPEKLRRFRATLGDATPIIVGAGMTEANAEAQLALADGAIVGSWLKEGHVDKGLMSAEYAQRFMGAVRRARAVLA
ncbi:BtpA/SgcQ family protein [Xinfangfangia sp. CPCC 101601]|uniref:BtpA/SgcQ family protein n=1 Tax=Pseudogemmobacter lacusdianii TaxID=3069608 RepID=A0ABU0W0L5_9RHOB|nr:BtpA/SgcQ family protein [Xinfangfangia sp. CPCC 101601]MDQ2067303.1 BtpA/SgcQ family protein [Xinfangfangia sp. CPCC 101601]